MFNLVQAAPTDDEFLYALYAETRRDELNALGWDDTQRNAFLRMQFDAQRRSYRMQYARFEQSIVYRGSETIGQISKAFMEDAIVLVDISIVSIYRCQGIGGKLINELQEAAKRQGKKVLLHVLQASPAARLYHRLGFQVTAERFPYMAMEWEDAVQSESLDN
ncbi:GNAT family N-acetyltransferase [Paenibacillus ferrarius]|uniref:GNAT family N-acetyltransferase n=1 Tax=Paenibacillus ferrarius TaxID=1469647 RepID=UPI003D26B2FC